MLDQYRFRNLCGRFATGVAVITAFDADDQPAGMTANSFASLSLVPPLVTVAIDHAAASHELLTTVEQFTINVLEASQEELSRRFAATGPDRFDGIGWHRGDDGSLRLDGVLAHLVCHRYGSVAAGDHTLIMAEVLGGDAADHGRPLLYYRGGYAEPDTL